MGLLVKIGLSPWFGDSADALKVQRPKWKVQGTKATAPIRSQRERGEFWFIVISLQESGVRSHGAKPRSRKNLLALVVPITKLCWLPTNCGPGLVWAVHTMGGV